MKNKLNFYSFLSIFYLMFIFSGCGDDNSEPEVKNPDPETENPAIKDGTIKSFIFESTKNGLKTQLKGVFENNKTSIVFYTQDWIENIDKLVATFDAEGTVKVGDIEQVSGATINDFRKELEYKVYGDDDIVKTYTVSLVCPQLSGLPVFKIDTESGLDITSKEEYQTADIRLTDSKNTEYSFTSTTEIRGRGNSTWSYDKKPYRLKFFEKISLFGYPAEKSWVLLANWLDPTFLMNAIAFEMGNRFGLPYTNHSTHIELFLNGKYKGNYVLTEQVQVKKNRVNVDEKKGFLIELDSYYDEDPKFKTNILRLPIMIKSPEDLDNPSGYDFVKEAVNELEAALYASDFPNNGYQNLIDVNTFIDFMLVNEIVRNIEVKHPKSIYMYKKDQSPDSKICMGPLWDFDWAFGYQEHGQRGDYFMTSKMTDILIKPNDQNNAWIGHRFFGRFLDDPDFRAKYKARWNEHYVAGKMNIDVLLGDMVVYLEKSQTEDYKLWNNPFNHKNQISQLKSWWNQRIDYLNREINKTF